MGRQKNKKPIGKLVVRKNQVPKNGIVPVYITYSINGKVVSRTTDVKVHYEQQWDASNQKVVKHPDANRLNNKLAKKKREFDERIETYEGVLTPEILGKLLDGEAVGGRQKAEKTDFIQYARDINERRYNNEKIGYSVYYNAGLYLDKFAGFIKTIRGEASIPISELTLDIIEQYKDERRKKISQATINKEIVPIIKAIDNAERNGLVDPSRFGDLYELYVGQSRAYGNKVDEDETEVHYLTKEQMAKLVECYPKLKYKRQREFVEMFLFSFHACGLRVSDIATLEWKHIDFEKQRMQKVLVKGKNFHEIHLNEYAIAILNKWKAMDRNPRFVFDLLPADFQFTDGEKKDYEKRLKNKIGSKNRLLQTSLNGVGKKIGLDFGLSMHVARHTFAVWALNYRDISLHLVSRLLGHKSIEATEKNYAKFLQDTIDEVIEKKATFEGCLPDALAQKQE